MHWVFTPYVLPLLVSTAVSGALGIHLWQRQATPGSRPFAATLLAIASWSFFYMLAVCSVDLGVKIIFSGFEFVGIVAVPVLWLVFTLEYTGLERWLTRTNLVILTIIPFATILFYWTNPYHHLLWNQVHLESGGAFVNLVKTYGPWFWVFTTYAYALLLLGSFLLIRSLTHTSRWYSRQVLPLLVGILLPWIGNLLYISGINPLPDVDLTPVLFAVSGVLLVLGVFRYWLFDLVPVARAAVIDVMGDGVLVVDSQDRLVDVNYAGARFLGLVAHEAIGQKVVTILARYPELWEHFQNPAMVRTEITLEEGDDPRYFDLRVSPLYDWHHHMTGRILVLHEISERRRAEQDLEKSHALLLATFEATADGILVVNGQGKSTLFNRKFSEMWRLPEDTLRTEDDHQMMAFILDQLANPAAFYRLMNKLAVQPEAESFDVLELKDGRVFERYSRPQRIEEKRVGRVWSFHDVTEQRRAEERLRYLSTHDILTGLYNRVYYEEELNRLEGSRQYPISMIIADVDGLKTTNDRYGHLAGDALLRRAAEVLKQACRSEDMVARIGGDEFGVVLPYSDTHVADHACQRVENMLGTLHVGELELALSLSLGAATARNGESLRKTLRLADKAMYLAKRSKRLKRSPEADQEATDI
ncbi:MAG: histidine kinase N-terminal 7TM domain-containing protein [Anaerolineaceae bacterium]|nr:histidine kinase N-terminal 7TM domain-containing protein [Anaerolineaceae bacterium]